MYFKRLEIIGFKSFANKTILDFEPGVTAIIGPNGCGKSNIFDAIRWVLGEQSAKSLRGSQMGDVIFNGTETQEGVGFAEASLVFDNTNKNLPIEYEEVIITRRLYRSGESEYLINKNSVRLKDVFNVFMGTGIGAESYSFVGQGKIDLIVSVKPEERRYIIDEAAGITKYKVEKKETLRKLEETENNLLRVNDIVAEVKRHINSLERQANKAQRYKEQFGQLKILETKLAYYKIDSFEKEKLEKEKQIGSLNLQEQRLKEEFSAKSLNSDSLRKDLSILQKEMQQENNNILEAKKKEEINNQNMRLNEEHIEGYGKFITELQQKKEELTKRIQTEAENIQLLESEASLLENKFKEMNAQLIKAENAVNQNEAAVKMLQSHILNAKNEIFNKTSELVKIKNDITNLSGQVMSWQARKRRLDIEIAKIKQEKSTLYEQYTKVKDEANKAEYEITMFKQQMDELVNSIQTKTNELNELSKMINDFDSEMLTLQSQKEFLQDLKLRYDSLPASSKGIIFVDSNTLTESGFLGRVFQVQDAVDTEKSILGLAYKSKFNVEIKPIDLDAKSIAKRIEQLEQDKNKLMVKKEGLIKNIKLEEEMLTGKEKELHQKEISSSNINLKKSDFEAQLVRFDEELNLVSAELSEASSSLSDSEVKLNNFKTESAGVERAISELEKDIEAKQQEIAICNNTREREIITLAKLKAQLSALGEAKNNQLQTRKLLEQSKSNHIIDRDLIETQEKDLKRSFENAQEEIKKLKLENTDISIRLVELENGFQAKQSLFEDTSEQIKTSEAQCLKLDGMLKTNNSEVFNLRLIVQEIEFKNKSILERMQQLYQIEKSNIVTDAYCLPNIQELEQEIDALRKKIDSYGTVNLVAVEEYEESKNRLEFLTGQSNDLLQAKEALEKAIKKINQTTRKLFLDTFLAVNEEFKNYFRILFGGGQAELFLLDQQEPLESGIEIVCRPPGKKLQNIALLSGGEKALAASALIFAIFKVKPAPFCILDEVDGALDEANIDRFRKLLEEFSKTSQFIVITHNKKTISSSDTMYGITMEQTGISKIVSVRFSKEQLSEDKDKEMVAV